MAGKAPAICNNVVIIMTRPSSPPVSRAFSYPGGSPFLTKKSKGFALVTLQALLGGLAFSVSDPTSMLSIFARVFGEGIVLNGAQVISSDGYIGFVGSGHVASPGVLVS